MKRIFKVLVTICILLVSCVQSYAMGFDAEAVYESIFVISTDSSLGSGFAIGNNVIVTNAHVIEDSRYVNVTTYESKKYTAEIYALDNEIDIAVLLVDGADFVPLKIGKEDSIKIGEDIYTVGAPNSMAYTLTKGVISAKDRNVSGQTYIQIDAAINQGNSGGPLLNDFGEVLGINTLKLSNSEGIGLAIPISRVVSYLTKIGIVFDENNNAEVLETESVTDNSNNAKDNNEKDSDEDKDTDTVTENDNSLNKYITIAFALSFLLNIFFLIYIVYKKNGNKYITKIDPSDRTDFEIEIEE